MGTGSFTTPLTLTFLTFLLLTFLISPSTSFYPSKCIWCRGSDPYNPNFSPATNSDADPGAMTEIEKQIYDHPPPCGPNIGSAINCDHLSKTYAPYQDTHYANWLCVSYPYGDGHNGCLDKIKFGSPYEGCKTIQTAAGERLACVCDSDECNMIRDESGGGDWPTSGPHRPWDQDNHGNGDGGNQQGHDPNLLPGEVTDDYEDFKRWNTAPRSSGGGAGWIVGICLTFGLL